MSQSTCGSGSLSGILIGNQGDTIKGVWKPRVQHTHHQHGYHDYHGSAHGHHHEHGHHNHYLNVDWTSTPQNQANNAFIIELGFKGKTWHSYLDAEIKSGDIVFFDNNARVIRFLPRSYTETLGEISKLDKIGTNELEDESITLPKLSQDLQDEIQSILKEINSNSTSSIEIEGDGAHVPLSANLKLKQDINNALVIDEGAFVQNASIDFDINDQTIKFTDNLGTITELDLGSLQNDIYVTDVALNQHNELVLQRNGAADLILDLSSLQNPNLFINNEMRTVQILGDGTIGDPLRTSVNLSDSPLNALKEINGKLEVIIPEQNIEAGKGITVLNGNKVKVNIDNNPNNILLIEDGLFQGNSSIYFKNSTKELVFTDNKGEETTLDLSSLTTDLHVQDATLSGTELVLTINGSQSVRIDLQDLTKVSTQDSNSIEFNGDGTSNNKLQASVRLNTSSDNVLEETISGIKAPRDLSQYDNTNTNFAKKSDIKSGELSISGYHGIEGSGVFGQNSNSDVQVQLGLSTSTRQDIQQGKDAYSWGDHNQEGYVKTDTTYTAGTGLELDGTEFSIDSTIQPKSYVDLQIQNLDSELSTVQKSGAYSDLTGTPTSLSYFVNDVGFVTTVHTGSNGIKIVNDDIQAEISTQSNNILLIQGSGGLFAQNSSISYNQVSHEIEFVDNQGTLTKLDLGNLTKDVFIDSAVLDGRILKLITTDGSEVLVDLEDLTKSSTQNTSTVTISGTGELQNKLSAEVNVSELQNNAISIKQDGIYSTKDLHQYDNSISKFAKQSDIGDGTLTIEGDGNVIGTGTFNQNASQDSTIQLGLSQDILDNIAQGVQALSNQQSNNYVTEQDLTAKVIQIIEGLGSLGSTEP